MTENLIRIYSPAQIQPGSLIRSALVERGTLFVVVAISRDALDRVTLALTPAAAPGPLRGGVVTAQDLAGEVEAYTQSALVILDGMPALGVNAFGDESPGTLEVDGGVLRWVSDGGRYRARLTWTGRTWYAPALDLHVSLGEFPALPEVHTHG